MRLTLVYVLSVQEISMSRLKERSLEVFCPIRTPVTPFLSNEISSEGVLTHPFPRQSLFPLSPCRSGRQTTSYVTGRVTRPSLRSRVTPWVTFRPILCTEEYYTPRVLVRVLTVRVGKSGCVLYFYLSMWITTCTCTYVSVRTFYTHTPI